MEARAAGTADLQRLPALLELLAALAGHDPAPIDVHEMVLRREGSGRQEVNLRRLITSGVAYAGDPARPDVWVACQYSLSTVKGDLAMAKLPATVRNVTQARCAGPDVPAFWRGLGFEPRYQHYKRGHTFDVRRGSHAVQVLVSRLHAVAAAGAGPGDEVVPGQVLVEAWTAVADPGAYEEAIAAVVEVGKLLAQEGVALGPLPKPAVPRSLP